MSLFQVCPWWQSPCPIKEDEDDIFNLHCCRLGLEEKEKDYIVLGSYSGNLSIYYPSSGLSEDGLPTGYKATDLVLEKKLKAPIITVTSGKFSGSMRNEKINQLVILHPYSVCIYNIITTDGVDEHGTHSTLQLATEYKFTKYAFSLTKGNFGGIKGREFLCVTHMDGSLTFFEQDGISYQCILAGDKSIPFNMVYVPRTDSFVRVNSYWELECYSYQDLSQFAGTTSEMTPYWTVNIGEPPLDMVAVQVTKTTIAVLGERNFIGISDDGKVKFIKKLDFTPICFHPFVVGWYWEPNARLITAIASETASILIYEESKLIWAAQMDHVPVAVMRSNLKDLPAGLVTMTATGTVHVGYLGTEPHIFKVPPLIMPEMNFEKSQKELVELEKEIKQGIDFTDIGLINSSAEKDIEFSISVNSNLQKCNFEVSDNLKLDGNGYMCSVEVHFKTKINIDQMQICFNFTDGIKCSENIRTFNDVPPDTSEFWEVWFCIGESCNISSIMVESVISYINKQCIPRVLTKNFFLPLKIFYNCIAPQKDANIKITLSADSNEKTKVHRMSSIFPEFITDTDAQAIGLSTVWSERVVTIVAAKNTNRFRIQADSIEVIAPMLDYMIGYFQNLDHSGATQKAETGKKKKQVMRKNPVTITPYLPMSDVVQRLDDHYSIEVEIKKQTVLMDALWSQFKLFQRSLQTKPEGSETSGIMMLIEKNYDDLVKEGDKLLLLRNDEKTKRSDLSCAIGLTKNVISCLNLPEKTIEGLVAALTYPVEDWIEKCWEETAAPAFDMLTHYGPLRRNKNTPLDNQPSFNTQNFDYDKFKRHFTSLVDRACRLALDPKQRHQLNQEPVLQLADSKNNNTLNSLTQNTDSLEYSTASDTNENLHDSQNKQNSKESDESVHTDQTKSKESDWLNGDIPYSNIMMSMMAKTDDTFYTN